MKQINPRTVYRTVQQTYIFNEPSIILNFEDLRDAASVGLGLIKRVRKRTKSQLKPLECWLCYSAIKRSFTGLFRGQYINDVDKILGLVKIHCLTDRKRRIRKVGLWMDVWCSIFHYVSSLMKEICWNMIYISFYDEKSMKSSFPWHLSGFFFRIQGLVVRSFLNTFKKLKLFEYF